MGNLLGKFSSFWEYFWEILLSLNLATLVCLLISKIVSIDYEYDCVKNKISKISPKLRGKKVVCTKLVSNFWLQLLANRQDNVFLLIFCKFSSTFDISIKWIWLTSNGVFQFEGKILPPDNKPSDWHWTTRILIDGGRRVAFVKVCLQLWLHWQHWY